MSFGVAGSNPLADYPQTVNKILCDSIKNKWDSDYATPNGITYPLASDMFWLQTWRTGNKDIELIFLQGFLDRPLLASTTDWRYESNIETVDCHVWVRGAGGDVEPTSLPKVLNGIKQVVALNKTTLVPNAGVRIASSQRAFTNEDTDFRNLWHFLIKMRVNYWTVSTL